MCRQRNPDGGGQHPIAMLVAGLLLSWPEAVSGRPPQARSQFSNDDTTLLQTTLNREVNVDLPGNQFQQGCVECCNDGAKHVPCLNVETCADSGPKNGKYAIVFSFVGKAEKDILPYILKTRAHIPHSTDLILLMPHEDAKDLDKDRRRELQINNVQLREVNWAVPPDMLFHPTENWCGPQDLIRLHVLGLEGYDAVAYYDNDIEFQQDVTPVLRCAATGRMLTTNGGVGEPLNVGFFAVRPDKRLLLAARVFARTMPFDKNTGWGQAGYAPSEGYFIGGECGQGFFHTLFYQRHSNASQVAFAAAGLSTPGAFNAAQIDRCVWNYQTDSMCEGFDCSRVRAHHKPPRPGSDPNECLKSGQRWVPPQQQQKQLALLAEPKEPTFGFWFPVFNEVSGVLRVVSQVRRFYPSSPILLLSDGGKVDFSSICQLPKYGCSVQHVKAENSRWNPHSWFKRMRAAVQQLRTDYVIYLEPDVEIRHRHEIQPQNDAGGVFDNFNPALSLDTVAYLERLGRERNPGFRLNWPHFGLTGGAYFRTEAVLDAFAPENVARLDFVGLFKAEYEKVWSSDLAMHLALSARGWDVYPWKECAQFFQDAPKDGRARAAFAKEWPALNVMAAFEHNHKEHYGEQLPVEEESLIQEYEQEGDDVTCHGCVWYKASGEELPVPSEAPQVSEANRFGARAYKKRAVLMETAKNSPAIAVDRSQGLPIETGKPRPVWIARDDGLVVDARSPSQKETGGGILVVQAVFTNAQEDWGKANSQARPRWLRSILATNREHIRQHGHAMVLRWLPTQPQLTGWQLRDCTNHAPPILPHQCELNNERENFNWDKHVLLSDYLESPANFSHVLLLDADAALVRTDHNTLTTMAALLEHTDKDLLLSDEDWLLHGEGRINGGLVFAKNTDFTRTLFRDTFDCHRHGPDMAMWRLGVEMQCTSNEQIALNDLKSWPQFSQRTVVTSGKKYNRGGCTLWECGEGMSDQSMKKLKMKDPELEIMHFMGGSKIGAPDVLCEQNAHFTGEHPDKYGCAEDAAVDVD